MCSSFGICYKGHKQQNQTPQLCTRGLKLAEQKDEQEELKKPSTKARGWYRTHKVNLRNESLLQLNLSPVRYCNCYHLKDINIS